MPGSGSMTTWRVSSVLIVGAVSGVSPGLWPNHEPNIEQAPSELVSSRTARMRGAGASSARAAVAREGIGAVAIIGARRSGLGRMVALLRLGRAVVELRDREAGLRGVAGEAFLLRHQLGHRDDLQRALLFLRQR